MLKFLKKIFGKSLTTDFKQLKNDGAVIVDVRSIAEFKQGHIKGSLNIPVDTLQNNLAGLKSKRAVITCCASGMRSRMAVTILKKNGIENAYNGGAWTSLQDKI